MARYTTVKEFSFGKLQETRAVIPDSGASLAIEFWNGATWTADSKSPITAPDGIYTKGLRVRITPSSGGFFIEEGDSQ